MRIIAGSKRSMPLKTIAGKDTRPTTDRIKETLFNMIQGEVPGAYFLDLFAGSGQIGLEALPYLWKVRRKQPHVLKKIFTLQNLIGKAFF